jgi:DNA-binding SARP family transcriptional activator/tetratricopeptide (TPR) repeat protein
MDGHIWLRVLGPVEVRDSDAWLSPNGPQLRLLLAVLALSAGHAVSAGELVDVLWQERPPPSARASLQILVTRLRKALAGVPGFALERCGDGYLLRLSPDSVDVHLFRSLVRSAREASEHEAAIAALGKALMLWRGPALANVPETAGVEAIRSGLAEEHLSAAQERFGRLLAAGRDEEAAAGIPPMLARHPLAERLAGMLMLAWYRCGRQADALQVFRDLRARLVRELGVEPGPELQELHRRILSGDPELRAADDHAGHGTASKPDPGPDRLDRPPLAMSAAAVEILQANGNPHLTVHRNKAASVVPRQLPAAPWYFTGRQRELRLLSEWLNGAASASEPAILTIGGTAGLGKTALALKWAHQVQRHFPDGQLYVNLRGFDASPTPLTPAEAISGFLESLGVAPGHTSTRLDARAGLYRSRLAGRRMLIVLDNARDEAQVRPLLPGSPGCVVLVTGRSDFAGLVATEGARPLMLDILTEPEARELLASRLGAARVAAEAEAVTKLTALCARLPLALTITAARAAIRPAFSLASIADGLQDTHLRLDTLDSGDQAASVRAVFSWSYRLLGESAARMFRLLGAHPGPDISEAAAASLAAVTTPLARAALRELVRANLIQEQSPGRFTFHELLREYAADLCHEKERRAALQRVVNHYLSVARAAVELAYPGARQITGPLPRPAEPPERPSDPAQALAWLRAEHRVLLAATTAAGDYGFDAVAWQLPAVLRRYFARCGHYSDWAESQQKALAAADRLGDRAAQALAHRNLGDALIHLGLPADARGHLQEALDLYLELGDHAGQAACHCSTARIFELREDHSQALYHAGHALRLYRAADDPAGQANALNGVGWFSALLGDNRRALSYCAKALELHRAAGNRFGEAAALDSLGYCCHQAGRHSQAAAFYQQALDAYEDAGERYLSAHTLIRLGQTRRATGLPEAARDLWQDALAILDDLHHPDADPIRAQLRDMPISRPAPIPQGRAS